MTGKHKFLSRSAIVSELMGIVRIRIFRFKKTFIN